MQYLPLLTEPESVSESCPEISHLVQRELSVPCLAPEAIEEHKQGSWGLVGLNHRTAPIQLRSRAALAGELCRNFLRKAKESGLEECAVLSTCNRTEIYYSGGAVESIRHAFSAISGIPLETLKPHLYSSSGICGACHLVRVVAGLDSAVLGETEIVSQVKEAWRIAQDEGTSGPMLDLLFRKALEAGKRIRSQTELCRSSTSMGALAVRQAEQLLGTLNGKHAVVIGAGQIGEKAAKELARVEGCRITIVNRSPERALRVASNLKNVGIARFEKLPEVIDSADAIFCGVSVEQPLLSDKDFRNSSGKPVVVVDFGVPPNAQFENPPQWLSALNVDQLRDESAANEERKLASVSPALNIVEEELKRFSHSLIERSAAPMIRALSKRAQEVESMNLAWAEERLSHLSQKDWKVVEQLASKLARGMLERPIDHLKSAPPSDSEKELISRLFGLEDRPA